MTMPCLHTLWTLLQNYIMGILSPGKAGYTHLAWLWHHGRDTNMDTDTHYGNGCCKWECQNTVSNERHFLQCMMTQFKNVIYIPTTNTFYPPYVIFCSFCFVLFRTIQNGIYVILEIIIVFLFFSCFFFYLSCCMQSAGVNPSYSETG